MSLTLYVIRTLREFYRVRREWNDLLEHTKDPSIFLTAEWLGTWWSAFGKGKRFSILLARSPEGLLVGALPLYRRHRWVKRVIPIRELRFVGTGALVCPDHLNAMVLPGYEEPVLEKFKEFLLSIQKEWDLLVLSDMDKEAPFGRRLAEVLKGNGRGWVEIEESETVPFISLEGKSWETYIASLSDNMQKNIRRRRRKIASEFQARFIKSEGKTPSKDFDSFTALHGKRRESIGGKDKFAMKTYHLFHRRLLRKLAKRDWLHLSFLELNGEKVAAQYGFEYGGRLFAYQTGFEPRYKQWGVFQLLLGYVIEDAVARGLKDVDLLRGKEAYKYDWTQEERRVVQHRIFGGTLRGRSLARLARLREKGKALKETALDLARKISRRLIWKDTFKIFVCKAERRNPQAIRTLAKNLECRWIDPEDRSDRMELVRLKGEKNDRKFVARWKRGHRCFGGFSQGRLIHASWLNSREWFVWEDSRRRALEKNSVFFYDALTQGEYRGRGVAVEAFYQCCSLLVEEGVQGVYAVIAVQNKTSLKTYKRVGFQETGQTMTTVRVIGRTLYEKVSESKTKSPLRMSKSGQKELEKPRILTTYPIPQSALWQERTHLISPRPARRKELLERLGFRDWTIPFRLLKARKDYRVLITGSEREDCLFALLQGLLPGRKIPHLMTCCLWKYETHPIRRWIKGVMLRAIAHSVTCFLVWSRHECEAYSTYFRIPREKFVFMPHHVSLQGYDVKAQNGDYIFAGGDSSRDYDTLLEAVAPLSVQTFIVAKQAVFWNGKRLPSHVTVRTTDPVEFRKLMANSRMVVLPLTGGILQSTGQQSYLNAMSLKKPVIVSDVPGVRDHILPGTTGIVVPPGDPLLLRKAILRVLVGGPEIQKMVEVAYERVQKEFSLDQFVDRLLTFKVSRDGRK